MNLLEKIKKCSGVVIAPINTVFRNLFVFYLIILVLDQYENRITDPLLAPAIILGTLAIILPQTKDAGTVKTKTKHDKTIIYGLLVVAELLIFIKIRNMGWISFIILFLAGIILLGLMLSEQDIDLQNPNDQNDIQLDKKTLLIVVTFLLSLSTLLFFKIGLSAFRVVFTGFYILFLGGYLWSYVFFRYTDINSVERVCISFLMSIIVLPLLVYYLKRIGLSINLLSVISVNFFFCLSGFLGYIFVNKNCSVSKWLYHG